MKIKFKTTIREEAGLKQIDIAPLIDIVFQLLIFFMLTSSFLSVPGINIKLPKAFTSERVDSNTLTIVITSADIFYIEDKPVLLSDIDNLIKNNKYDSIFIKADRDASLGVLISVWDICKKNGIDKIGLATSEDDTYKK